MTSFIISLVYLEGSISGQLRLTSIGENTLENLNGTAADLLFATAVEVTDGTGNPQIAGSRDLSQGLITIDSTTSDLSFKFDNASYSVALAVGYYDPDQLLSEVQSKLDDSVGNGKILGAYDDGHLTLTNSVMGNLDIIGGGAVDLLLGTYSEKATNQGKITATISSNHLTLTNADISGTLDGLNGTAADLLFNQHSTVTTSPKSTTKPDGGYTSPDPFTGMGHTTTYTVEGFAVPKHNYYAGMVIGAVDLSGGITIDGSNNTMNIAVTSEGVGASYNLTLNNGHYTSSALLSTLQAKLSGTEITATYNGSGNLMLTQSTAGSGNSFKITNSSLGKALLEKSVANTDKYYYLKGGTNNIDATYTGTRDLSHGLNITTPLTLGLSRDGEPWDTVQLPQGNYATADAIKVALNEALSGIADVIVSVVGNSRLQLIYQKNGVGHTLSVDSNSDGYKPLFEAQIPNYPFYSSGTLSEAQAVGQKDISGGVVLKEDNNVLTYRTDGIKRQVVLDQGSYDFNNNAADLEKLNAQLKVDNVKASMAGNRLVFTYDNHIAGTHEIDSIGGSASYALFYNGSDDVSASYIKGQRDLSAGVTIVSGQNDSFTFNLDGQPQELLLSSGSYTKDQIVTELQKQLVAGTIDMTVLLTDTNRIEFKHNRNGIHTIDNVGGSASKEIFYNDKGTMHNDDNLRLQVGANSGQILQVEPPRINLEVLGIEHLNVTRRKTAEQAIRRIDHAVLVTSNERSRVGAYHNALEHLAANVSNAEENMIAAESRIRDVDMAKEVMNFQKNSILFKAAQAMLAQANQQPQRVLQLLR